MVLALERYILPYMDAMSVKKLLSFMVKGQWRENGEEEIFQVYPIVYFSDKYFACMNQAAVYGVGMWIAERYAEGFDNSTKSHDIIHPVCRNHTRQLLNGIF